MNGVIPKLENEVQVRNLEKIETRNYYKQLKAQLKEKRSLR